MTTYQFDHLLADGSWLSPGYVTVDDAGAISEISSDAPDRSVEKVSGIAIPGVPNVHSHAFQRAMAGLGEHRTVGGEDSFWSWRELMYRFVERITPDDLEAIAAQLYVEMLKSGYTTVGEFQYLHHDRDGSAFADPAEMTLRTVAAARDAGIGATFLPVLYQHAGFGGAPVSDAQKRFVNDTDKFLHIYETVSAHCKDSGDLRAGIAPHSLRAVGEAALQEAVAAVPPETPVHIHIAEQEKEVSECVASSGLRPVAWLLEKAPVDRRWCLVHATHMTDAESHAAAQTGATAGLCPTTEANLGDGIFELPRWFAENGRIGLGSDSHISIDPREELRWLEYGQRLRDRRRNVAAADGGSTGQRLFDAVISGGARALGREQSGLSNAGRAEIVVLDADSPMFAGQSPETFLDTWIFSGQRPVIKDVFVGGVRVVHDGVHMREQGIAARFRKVVRSLLAA